MSQVAKSASAFVRAFLAILVLELEDMVVRLVCPPKLVRVHGDRWTVRMLMRSRWRASASRPAAAGDSSRSRRRMMPISLESRGRTSGRDTRFGWPPGGQADRA